MDPLGAVYLKKSGTGSAVTFGKTENKLDDWLKADKTKTATDDIDRDLAKLGGVWEQDIPELTEMYKDYKLTLKDYEKERDPTRKAQLYNDVIRKGMSFETYTTKSKTNKQNYFNKSQELAKDKNAFYSDDAPQLLEAWKNKKITERPDDMGIEMPLNTDPALEFAKLMKMSLQKPQSEQVEVIQGGKRIKTTQLYYTDKDIEQAKETSYTRLKPNLLRVEKAKIADQVADKRDQYGLPLYSPKEVQEAQQAWQLAHTTDPTAVDKLIKDRLFAYYQPSLASQGVAIRPYIPPRSATGAGGGKDKFQIGGGKVAMVETVNGKNTGQEDNWIATTSKIGGPMPVIEWMVGTKDLQEIANATGNQDLANDLAGKKSTNQQYQTITGTLEHIGRNSSGDYIVVSPKTALGKYDMSHDLIVIPLTTQNKSKVSSMFNGNDATQLLNEIQGSTGTTTKEVTPKAPPTLKVKNKAAAQPGAPAKSSKGKGTLKGKSGRNYNLR